MVGVGSGTRGYVDETSTSKSVADGAIYTERLTAIGALVDVMLSETRDMAAAEKFFLICQSGHRCYSGPSDHGRA